MQDKSYSSHAAGSNADMKESVYDHVEPGVWTQCSKNFDLACCDCSLVHTVSWRIKKVKGRDELQLKFFRSGPSTGGLRKAMRASAKKKAK